MHSRVHICPRNFEDAIGFVLTMYNMVHFCPGNFVQHLGSLLLCTIECTSVPETFSMFLISAYLHNGTPFCPQNIFETISSKFSRYNTAHFCAYLLNRTHFCPQHFFETIVSKFSLHNTAHLCCENCCRGHWISAFSAQYDMFLSWKLLSRP